MTSDAEMWQTIRLPISSLDLDWQNPRLPPEQQDKQLSQEALALFIDAEYNPLQVAESIARHGYFESEPLIAVEEKGRFRVLEGNRRLTALKGLADADLRSRMARENFGWKALVDVELPEDVPVVVVQDPSSVVPLLGFRHISGIAPWDPFQQAGYIARLVESGESLDDVADMVGRSRTEVKSMYRDFDIIRQAREQFGFDVARATDSFGVFSAAMGRVGIRNYISAPAPREVDPENWPVPEHKRDATGKLLGYIFGDSRGDGRVVRDSRQLKQLSQVLSDPDPKGIDVLNRTRSLDDALESIVDADIQWQLSITSAHKSLKKVIELEPAQIDEPYRKYLRELSAACATLLSGPRHVEGTNE